MIFQIQNYLCDYQANLTMLRHLLFLLVIVVVQVSTRGPANPPPLKDQLTPEYFFKRIWGEILGVLIFVGVILLCCAGLFFIYGVAGFMAVFARCCCVTNNPYSRENTHPCYLCQRRVRKTGWESGEHRKKCATKKSGAKSRSRTTLCYRMSRPFRAWPTSMCMTM